MHIKWTTLPHIILSSKVVCAIADIFFLKSFKVSIWAKCVYQDCNEKRTDDSKEHMICDSNKRNVLLYIFKPLYGKIHL